MNNKCQLADQQKNKGVIEQLHNHSRPFLWLLNSNVQQDQSTSRSTDNRWGNREASTDANSRRLPLPILQKQKWRQQWQCYGSEGRVECGTS